ncbi:DNA mismatch repair protein MutS [Mesorhizobium composti]|uniref:DNA mismatch repair protein MutS n=1 Tax=Ollibium composti TaxID=2675109 RepID=A0ABY2QAH0_9HYPH|nr:DNA mismatch repair protein MutS [Mesorhizobium composti]
MRKQAPGTDAGEPSHGEGSRGDQSFESILFARSGTYPDAADATEPSCFGDLNLDQVVASVTANRAEYNLKGFFHTNLLEVDDVAYRHEVMRDLERNEMRDCVLAFAQAMKTMREHFAQMEKIFVPIQKQAWFLDAVDIYSRGVLDLTEALGRSEPRSRGLRGLLGWLRGYVASKDFPAMRSFIETLQADFAKIRYCVYIRGEGFVVHRYEGENDYSAEIEQTFRKFQQGSAKSYLTKIHDYVEMNHIEAKILEFVSLLFPDPFKRLAEFCRTYQNAYLPALVARFDREVQVYLSYLEYIDRLRPLGLKFCYPELSKTDKSLLCREGFDIALATKLAADDTVVVTNDFELSEDQRVIVVSGPNQGGKTTFARMFGQLHHLASLGFPVPGKKAKLFLPDNILTHFEREEDLENLSGKLQDDLKRVHDILDVASGRSIVIMNEIFTSTTLQDATFLSRRIMRKIIALDALCVWITFIHELASFSKETVSMMSMVVPEDPAQRTFKVVRAPASGRSYAMSIAEKYRLTSDDLEGRLP